MDREHEIEDVSRQEYYEMNNLEYPTYQELYRKSRTPHIRKVEYTAALTYVKWQMEIKNYRDDESESNV